MGGGGTWNNEHWRLGLGGGRTNMVVMEESLQGELELRAKRWGVSSGRRDRQFVAKV